MPTTNIAGIVSRSPANGDHTTIDIGVDGRSVVFSFVTEGRKHHFGISPAQADVFAQAVKSAGKEAAKNRR